jgi:hypothetical protein
MARWRIRQERRGSGGFLSPPGHPTLTYTVEEYAPNQHGDNVRSSGSLEWAAREEYVPAAIRARARAILNRYTPPEPPSEDWLAHVYAYFRGTYSPDGTTRNVSEAWYAHEHPDEELPPPERSLAVLKIRDYYPGHAPRLDLLDQSGGYGTRPCDKCGRTVQYEARLDGWAPFNGPPLCDDGGPHVTRRAATVGA